MIQITNTFTSIKQILQTLVFTFRFFLSSSSPCNDWLSFASFTRMLNGIGGNLLNRIGDIPLNGIDGRPLNGIGGRPLLGNDGRPLLRNNDRSLLRSDGRPLTKLMYTKN